MHVFSKRNDWKPWIAFAAPILFLIVVRYVPTRFWASFNPYLHLQLIKNPAFTLAPFFLGISYLAFRCSHLVLEVRNGVVKKPGFWEYLGFCFFVPTMTVGPINPYSNHRRGFAPDRPSIPLVQASLRIVVGAVKYLFLGNVFNQLGYSSLLLDDHYHHWIDLPIAAVFYALYLYVNFSGFCDMAIGGGGADRDSGGSRATRGISGTGGT
jgi:D-alanyl-lipoteichoic acid acyltransferase DltB (MBOAT superfamily)